ncbi:MULTISPECIES: hypothetical protein [Pseudoalteromonas]|uniref:capsular polysaccharide export protein, LipB/KpsS family n=1 Tax=Pseudoalteromonas TaxID=53246 RepID=UPI001581EDD5|nr:MULTISPECIES: hypothetical protein [Pseudoalteromonas]MDI4652857.1 hypothetical protein [Pseudoalteromonas shioyasakiensis]NUJ39646.1 hypothetical protein [Pseudoalteromonas sp. 0303]
MRILIYEPLADMVKAPFFSSLGTQLASEGHDVIIACEQKVIYTLQGRLTEKGVINCTSTICAHIASNKSIRYTCFMPNNKALYKNVSQHTLADKLNTIARYRNSFYSQLLNEFNPDLIYIWNGQAEHQQDFVILAKNLGFKFNYLELGWFPQKNHYYIDPIGVNANSSIANLKPYTLKKAEKDKLEQWVAEYTKPYSNIDTKKKQILVPLQVDTDTNITNHSPFSNMREFIEYLELAIPDTYTVIIRPHPLAQYAYSIKSQKPNFFFNTKVELYELIAQSEYIIGINSTVLLEGICFGKKVCALGEGIIPKRSLDNFLTKNENDDLSYLLYNLIFKYQKEIILNFKKKNPVNVSRDIRLKKLNQIKVHIYKNLYKLTNYLRSVL